MSIIPLEQKEEYKAIIRRIMAMNPTLSIREIHRRLAEADKPIALDREYLGKLVQEIRRDRITEIENETKEDIYAKMSDVVEFVNQQLRAIAQEEKLVYMDRDAKGDATASPKMRIFAQQNRTKALNSVIDNLLKLYNLKMDLGIIERKVGTMDHLIIDTMSALKKIRNGDYTTDLEKLIPAYELTAPVSANEED
jgi:hypothetical protein